MHRIEGGHHSQQDLCGADVAGGFVAADVLFSRLQCQPQSGIALGISGLTHQATGDLAFVGLPCSEKGSMGPAKTHRYTEALSTSNRDIGTKVGNWCDQGLSQRINGHRGQSTNVMGTGDHLSWIPELTVSARQLDQNPNTRSSNSAWTRSTSSNSMPKGWARVCRTA